MHKQKIFTGTTVKFLLLFLGLNLITFNLQAQYTISGKVIDTNSMEGLPFVNILINNSLNGGSTDLDGKFTLHSENPIDSLTLSYIGYNTLVWKLKDQSYQTIKMKAVSLYLEEVSILPGINPAHRIIRKAIENKDKHNPENYPSWKFISYNKMVFTADPEQLSQSANPLTEIDTNSMRNFLENYHFFIMESVSERMFMQPDRSLEKVIASKISGISDPMFTMLFSQIQSFSFYKETIGIYDKQYVNPLSNGSIKKYAFWITDTTYQQADTVFIISFRPKLKTHFDGLKGSLYINTDGFAVQNVLAEPANEQESLGISIQQKYEKVDGTHWFPTQLNTEMKFYSLEIAGINLVGKGRTYIRDIEIGADLKKRYFGNSVVQIDPQANYKKEEFWDVYRQDSLSIQDINTYRLVDSIGKEEGLDRTVFLLKTLLTGSIPIGFINLDIDKILDYNDYEGFRLGLGAHTNSRLIKWLSLGGYYNYGFKDQKAKYGADIDFTLSAAHFMHLRFYRDHNIREEGRIAMYDEDNIFSYDDFRDYLVKDFYLQDRIGANFEFRFLRYAILHLDFSEIHAETLNDYLFGKQDENIFAGSSGFDLYQSTVAIRYAPGETFIQDGDWLMPVNIPNAVFYLQHERGNIIAGRGIEFNKLLFRTDLNKKWKYTGTSSFRFDAGWVDRSIPAQLLFSNKGAFRNFTVDAGHSFATMRMHEFLSDSYIHLFYSHNFGHLLFEWPRFKPEPEICLHAGFGGLRNPENHKGWDFKSMEKGYYESGLLINKILDVNVYSLGIGAFYRFGPYSFPEVQDNISIRFSLRFAI